MDIYDRESLYFIEWEKAGNQIISLKYTYVCIKPNLQHGKIENISSIWIVFNINNVIKGEAVLFLPPFEIQPKSMYCFMI